MKKSHPLPDGKSLQNKRLATGLFYPKLAVTFCLLAFLINCVSSSLSRAKADYLEAEALQRSLRLEEATAVYKKTREEVSATISRKPTAEGYLLKGLTEVNLNLWAEAEDSFRMAASLVRKKPGTGQKNSGCTGWPGLLKLRVGVKRLAGSMRF